MTIADPRTAFAQFYDNPAIQALATACRWTISGQIGELETPANTSNAVEPTRKAPIDTRHLLDYGRIRGAWSISPDCLVTLDDLTQAIPDAANTAFYLQSQVDGLMVIDIEPACPAETTMSLLRLPGILYSEISMSGRGYHLVVALPDNFYDFPTAAGKRVLREKQGHYEILLDHWTTFTRVPIPQPVLDQAATAANPSRFPSVEELYAELAGEARETLSVSAAAIDINTVMPDIPHADTIVANCIANADGQLRDPEYFDHDMSRWEFSVLGSLYGWLRTQLTAYSAFGVEYDTGEQIWLLYRAAKQILPFRPKHAQQRNGRPFLLDRAAALVAAREGAEKYAHRDSVPRSQKEEGKPITDTRENKHLHSLKITRDRDPNLPRNITLTRGNQHASRKLLVLRNSYHQRAR